MKQGFIFIFFISLAISQKVLLRNVEVVTGERGLLTKARRGAPVLQLKCKGEFCHVAAASSIQCKNAGWDGNDVNWKCKAQLASGYELDTTEVSCEGYEYPEDPYILAGSCGIEYSLKTLAPCPSGCRGDTGPIGMMGPRGEKGDRGPPGVQGLTHDQQQTIQMAIIVTAIIAVFISLLFFWCCCTPKSGLNQERRYDAPYYEEVDPVPLAPPLRQSPRLRRRAASTQSAYNQGYVDGTVNNDHSSSWFSMGPSHTRHETVIVERESAPSYRPNASSPPRQHTPDPPPPRQHTSTFYAKTKRR